MNSVIEFASAAAPWVGIGLFVAISCAWMSGKKK